MAVSSSNFVMSLTRVHLLDGRARLPHTNIQIVYYNQVSDMFKQGDP